MDPYSAAIGGAVSLASGLAGAFFSADANARAQEELKKQHKKNQNWYDMKSSQDYTNRSDVRATFKRQRELMDDYFNRSRAMQAVSGSTDEAVAMQQQQLNNTIADTTAQVAAQASGYKDALDQQRMQEDNAYSQQMAGIKQQQSQQIAAAGAQGVSAGLNLIGNGISSEPTKNIAGTQTPNTTDPIYSASGKPKKQ